MSDITLRIRTPNISNPQQCEIKIRQDAVGLTLKEKIVPLLSTPIDQQRLIYRGKVLKDDLPLSNYEIQDKDTISLIKVTNRPQPNAELSSQPSPVPAPSATPNFGSENSQFNSQFNSMFNNPAFRQAFQQQQPGSRQQGTWNNPGMAAGSVGGMPAGLTPDRMAQMANDPMFSQMLNDPRLSQMLASQNPQLAAMLQNPAMREQMISMLRNRGNINNPPNMNSPFQSPAPSTPAAPANPSFNFGMNSFNQPTNASQPTQPTQTQNVGGANSNSNPNLAFFNNLMRLQQQQQNSPQSSSTPSQAFPPPAPATQQRAPPTVSELTTLYAPQLQQLHAMGFYDDYESVQILQQTQGNVDAAIDRLLGGN